MPTKGNAPKAPDAKELAGLQTGTNISTGVANTTLGQVNQVGPGGSLTYKTSGFEDIVDPVSGKTFKVPIRTATTTLDAANQQIYDTGVATSQNLANVAKDASGRLGSLMGQPLSMEGLPEGGSSAGVQTSLPNTDYTAARDRVEAALLEKLNKQSDRDWEAQRTSLAQQGIALGSDAGARTMDQFQSTRSNDRINAILAAGDELSRMQGLDINAGNFANSAQAQQFNQSEQARAARLGERYAERNQPLNEILALAGGAQLQQPQFQTAGGAQIPTTDYAGLSQQEYANKLGAYNQQQQTYGDTLGGLFSLGGSLIRLSDERTKKDIRRVGTTGKGHGVFEFRYKHGGPVQLGLMAQDVESREPEAVINTTSGLKLVDYGRALEAAA